MTLSDKALRKIGQDVLDHAGNRTNQDDSSASQNKPATPVRSIRLRARGQARKAPVLAFRKRHR